MDYSLEFQLGLYIGEHIADTYLPSLSCDYSGPMDHRLVNRKIFLLTDEEAVEYKRLSDESFKLSFNKEATQSEVNKAWNKYLTYRMFLAEKHLPKVLNCMVRKINVDKIYDLKKGIEKALWDSDICSYHCSPETIEILEPESDFDREYYTLIRLNLDTSYVLQPEE